jgi:alanine dehydrogenase
VGVLFLTEADVCKLLPMSDAIRMVRAAFLDLATGDALNHPRRRLVLPARSVLHYMPGASGEYFGMKVYATNPEHPAHFLFLLYRASDAAPLALFEANHLGQIRTGAASGVATALLARPDASVLCVIGSGFQARAQVEAVACVRALKEVRVWSRNAERRQQFAAECASGFQLNVRAVETAREAVEGADIIVTATTSREPVLEHDWVTPGAHINAIGSNQAKRRELPAELVQRANLIVVDSWEQAKMESGDLVMAFPQGRWSEYPVVEMSTLVQEGAVEGFPGLRCVRGGQAVTVFKSNGLAVQDVACAAWIYEQAKAAASPPAELPLFAPSIPEQTASGPSRPTR